jgi:excisionase family DNA binding protein
MSTNHTDSKLILSDDDVKHAQNLKEILSELPLNKNYDFSVRLKGKTEAVTIPSAVFRDLLALLSKIEKKENAPDNIEISTTEAAKILNVSRPFVAKLMDEGRIPCRKVGSHRRVKYEDVIAFKQKDDRARQKVIDQLIRDAQEQDMGYNDT